MTQAETLQTNRSNYMIQLDSLRAIAVLGVLVHHFLPSSFILNSRFHWGPLGVRFFFVLSGFLITGILLRCKELVDLQNQGTWFTLKQFFARRILRLLPAYCLYLLIISVFAFNSVKNSLPWHLTYASNFYFSINDWDQYTSHFWSLSVEEQFYLFWAFLIMLLPRQYLLAAIISTILFAPLFRFMLFIMDLDNGIREYILTFSCFDSLGLGALLAFFSDARTSYKSSLTKACFWIGLPSFVLLNLLELPDNSYPVVLTFGPTAASLFFVWLTSKAAQGFGGLAGGILSFQPLVYLGKISYGIYVYHLLVPGAFNKVLAHLGLRHPSSIGLAFAFYATLTFIIAAMSWHFLELPIGALKRNFEYKATQNSR